MSTLEEITISRYLRAATCLKENLKEELKKLLAEIYSISGDWSQNSRKGEPAAAPSSLASLGFGGATMVLSSRPSLGVQPLPFGSGRSERVRVPHKYDNLFGTIETIEGALMETERYVFPGLYLFKMALKNFKECVNQERQGRSSSNLMPACQYLKGTLVMLLENQGYWEAKLAGRKTGFYVKDLELPNVDRSKNSSNVQPLPSVLPAPCQQPSFLLASNQQSQLQPAPHQVIGAPIPLGTNNQLSDEDEDQPSEPMEQDESYSININLEDRLYSGLKNLWKNKAHTDVTLLVKNKRIQAHRVILASRSDYFDRLVFGSMKERDQDEIEIKEIENVDLFVNILEYAYTGSIAFNGINVQGMFDIITLADRFGFLLLKNAVGAVLADKVNAQNVLKFLSPADAFCIDNLQQTCLSQLDKISTTVLNSEEFISLDPHLIKKVLSRDTFDAPEIKIFECLSKIIQKFGMVSSEASDLLESCICLSSMDIKDVFSKVEPLGYFTEKAILESVRANAQNDLNSIRGRGAKVTNVNMLSTASSNLHLRYQQQQGMFQIMTQHPSPPPLLTDGIIDLNKQSSSVKITLNKAYLINTIKIEVFRNQGMQTTPRPSSSTNLCSMNVKDSDALKTSFILKATKEDSDGSGLSIANYERYECMGEISLVFPSQAMRYIIFELKRNIPISVRFRECMYDDSSTKLVVGPNGTHAPVQEIQPLACQSSIGNTDSEVYKHFSQSIQTWNTEKDDGILMFLCQPYYLTRLWFTKHVLSSLSVARVFVSHNKTSEYKELSVECTVSNNILRCSSVFVPTVISYIFVYIPNNRVKVISHSQMGLVSVPVTMAQGIQYQYNLGSSNSPAKDKIVELHCKYEPKN